MINYYILSWDCQRYQWKKQRALQPGEYVYAKDNAMFLGGAEKDEDDDEDREIWFGIELPNGHFVRVADAPETPCDYYEIQLESYYDDVYTIATYKTLEECIADIVQRSGDVEQLIIVKRTFGEYDNSL